MLKYWEEHNGVGLRQGGVGVGRGAVCIETVGGHWEWKM